MVVDTLKLKTTGIRTSPNSLCNISSESIIIIQLIGLLEAVLKPKESLDINIFKYTSIEGGQGILNSRSSLLYHAF